MTRPREEGDTPEECREDDGPAKKQRVEEAGSPVNVGEPASEYKIDGSPKTRPFGFGFAAYANAAPTTSEVKPLNQFHSGSLL